MNKKVLLVKLLAVIGLIGCSVGNANNPTISAKTSGTCNQNMANGNICNVNITYNANGISNITFAVTYNPSLNPQRFVANVSSCNTNFVSTGDQTCVAVIQYNKVESGTTTQNLAFTLGTAASNQIQFTGN